MGVRGSTAYDGMGLSRPSDCVCRCSLASEKKSGEHKRVFIGRVGLLTFLGGRGGNSLGKAWVIIQIQRGTGPIRCVSRHAFAEKEMQRSRDMTGPPSN